MKNGNRRVAALIQYVFACEGGVQSDVIILGFAES